MHFHFTLGFALPWAILQNYTKNSKLYWRSVWLIVLRLHEITLTPIITTISFTRQEKQKRDAEEKVKQIRKTLQEQEHLQERLRQQKEESDADNEWLKSEDEKAYIATASHGVPSSTDETDSKTRLSKRHSYNGVSCIEHLNMR